MSRGQACFLVVIGLRPQPRCTSTRYRYHEAISMGCRSMEREEERQTISKVERGENDEDDQIKVQECRSWQNPMMR